MIWWMDIACGIGIFVLYFAIILTADRTMLEIDDVYVW